MTDATFNLNNYTDEEVLDLFGISKEDCQNKDKIYDQYNTIVKNIKTQNEFTPEFAFRSESIVVFTLFQT